jgi:hypothetical protein
MPALPAFGRRAIMGRTLDQIFEDAARHNTALAKDQLALSHGEAWEIAKREKNVSDVRKLTSEQFQTLVLRAEEIRVHRSKTATKESTDAIAKSA